MFCIQALLGLPDVEDPCDVSRGVNGYIYLSRDEESESCGILQDASYPVLDGAQDSLLRKGKGSGSAKDCGGGTVVFDERESPRAASAGHALI